MLDIQQEFIDAVQTNNTQEVEKFLSLLPKTPQTHIKTNRQYYSLHKTEKERIQKREEQIRRIRINREPNNPEFYNTLNALIKSLPYWDQQVYVGLERQICLFINSGMGIPSPHQADLLLSILEKNPEYFNSQLKNVFLHTWGNFPFDEYKHQKLENFFIQNSTNILNVFKNSCSINSSLIMSCEQWYEKQPYRKKLDELSKEEFIVFAHECMGKAMNSLKMKEIDFWSSFYIHLPEKKSLYSNFIIQANKSANCEDVIKHLAQMKDLDVAENVMLRTCISMKQTNAGNFLLIMYPPDKLETLAPFFEKRTVKDSSKYKDEQANEAIEILKPIWEKLKNYYLLNKELVVKDYNVNIKKRKI